MKENYSYSGINELKSKFGVNRHTYTHTQYCTSAHVGNGDEHV